MRKRSLVLVSAAAVLCLLAFLFVPMAQMESMNYPPTHAGGTAGHAAVSLSFYLFRCGSVYGWRQVSISPGGLSANGTVTVRTTPWAWICGQNGVVWR
jgi:hypothetical protein